MKNYKNLSEADKKKLMALEILSLQADLLVPRGNISVLEKMSVAWLQDCLDQLKSAEGMYRSQHQRG